MLDVDTVIQGEEMEPRKRGTDSDGDEEPSAKRQKPAAKRAKKATGGGSGKKSAFQKPLQLTPEMQEWYGPEQATRGGLTKRFYEYIDEHELKVRLALSCLQECHKGFLLEAPH